MRFNASRQRSASPRRQILEARHLFAMVVHDAFDLCAAQRLAPLMGATLVEETRLLVHCLDETVAFFQRSQRIETRMPRGALDARPVLPQPDQLRGLRE